MSYSILTSDRVADLTLSRRSFLKGLSAGSLVLMANLSRGQVASAAQADVTAFHPDFFVSIAPSGSVTILAHRSEMGTGIRTSLPRVVADELEADWERVEIQQAPGDEKLGDQNTDGSNSIRFFFDRMRVAGATARTMLEQAAAKQWGVDPGTCIAENHQVTHKPSGRTFGYGELVAEASKLEVPKPETLKLKPRSKWKYIGQDEPMTDLEDILTGKATYGIDARMENQLFAVIARPPVVGGKVKAFDVTEAKKIPGVQEIVELPGFEGAQSFSLWGELPSAPRIPGPPGKGGTPSRSNGMMVPMPRTTRQSLPASWRRP